jgi:hypothetical protein
MSFRISVFGFQWGFSFSTLKTKGNGNRIKGV